MDFSTTERALTSLQRRKPAVPEDIQRIAGKIVCLLGKKEDGKVNEDGDGLQAAVLSDEFVRLTTELVLFRSDAGDNGAKRGRWEPLAVGLHLSVRFLEELTSLNLQGHSTGGVYLDGPRVPILDRDTAQKTEDSNHSNKKHSNKKHSNLEFCEKLVKVCESELEHEEPRVRTLVAKVVGGLASVRRSCSSLDTPQHASLVQSVESLYQAIFASLSAHLAAGRDVASVSSSSSASRSSTGALDDTTGWRALETNLFAIGSFIHGSSSSFLSLSHLDCHLDDLLKHAQYCCVTHVNRHVRAAAIALLEQLVHVCTHDIDAHNHMFQQMLIDSDAPLRNTIVDVLKVTLADNWSQVRMAASVLCRVFLQALLHHNYQHQHQHTLDTLYPILLPRMCLNRFYLAQGVKLYSHETWKILFQDTNSGIESVAENAPPICRYYVQMCDADNHVVREAACQAVAELANKIGMNHQYKDSLAPFVPLLLQALLMCFHDESWPVRDEACLACGTFVLAYPEQCKPELPTLFSRWTEQLTDQIWSVREDAAVALGDAIQAYGQSMLQQVLSVLKLNLSSARDEPPLSREQYKKRQNDIDAHTNSQLYSCGSLAPKLRKGGAGRIGCSDCLISRPKAPWEATDGCIYLLRELCVRLCSNNSIPNNHDLTLSDDILLPFMTELADVCRVKHFPQSDDLRATLWKQLPFIARALGKQRFKRIYLQLFLNLLMSNLEDAQRGVDVSQLSVHAAGQCAEELANLVGMTIFRGRLEEDWQRDIFDSIIQERRQMGGVLGPNPASDAFSPFGPPGGIITRGRGEFTTGNGTNGDKLYSSPSSSQSMPNVPGNAFLETL